MPKQGFFEPQRSALWRKKAAVLVQKTRKNVQVKFAAFLTSKKSKAVKKAENNGKPRVKTAADFQKEAAKAAKASKYKQQTPVSPKNKAEKSVGKPVEKAGKIAVKSSAKTAKNSKPVSGVASKSAETAATIRVYPLLVDAVVVAVERI